MGAKWRLIGGILILGILVSGAMAWAATITVGPSGYDYTTIQAAVVAASNDDIITVAAGTYEVTATVEVNKSLTIQGAGIG